MDIQAIMEACLTWKHATYALAGLLMASTGGGFWITDELHELELKTQSVEQIKDDVQIIKECLIKKECG